MRDQTGQGLTTTRLLQETQGRQSRGTPCDGGVKRNMAEEKAE
jgi:hypothetical protein